MTDQSLVSLSIPDELQQVLEKYQQENGLESTSDAVVEVLKKFFDGGAATSAHASVKRVEALEKWVENLAEQVVSLNQTVKYLSMTRSLTRPVSSMAVSELDEDDIEDEPDEILLDFLPRAET
jgi:hypothetical protein